jgi:hypothetical protein
VFVNIKVSGIALGSGGQRKNYLFNWICFNAMEKFLQFQLSGTDAIHWGDNAAQNMIYAGKLVGVFNGNHIPDILNHANNVGVSLWVGANVANIIIGNGKALFANF